VPGHWEGDLIVGQANKSYVGTLVEPTTRFVVLLHLPDGPSDDQVIAVLAATIGRLPAQLRRSVTWDQGIEMVNHVRFTQHTGVPVYFAEARSPWQRGSNENTNGLLRQYLPKGSDLRLHSGNDLAAIAHASTSALDRPSDGRHHQRRSARSLRSPLEGTGERCQVSGGVDSPPIPAGRGAFSCGRLT
jgi:IS30 family transposase